VLDLVNTLQGRFRPEGPVEVLSSFGTLLMFMEQSGLLPDRAVAQTLARRPPKAEQILTSVRTLREAAAAVLYAVVAGSTPPAAEVGTLERFALEALQRQELTWNREPSDSNFAWSWRSGQVEPDLPLWVLALQTTALLTSPALRRVRSCHTDTCRALFLDTSRNHTRRWCDMKICGNRVKARRFQARRM
jgi:predicted RNA-binding Zn ribbon-like protein